MAGSTRLAGRTAVVTGAGSGIGREIAILFAAEGAAVICIDRAGDAAEDAARSICSTGAVARALVADVSDPSDVAAAGARILRECSSVDVLVNNAGGGGGGSIASVSIDGWREAVDLNLGGAFYLSKALWPAFARQRRGVIVNNGSIMGLAGDMNSIAYCSAKAALVGMTRCLAADGAAYGIRANCVCPGFVDTPAMRAVAADPAVGRTVADFERSIPLGRMASAREIAFAFLFLASDEASYVTGATLVVDGGAMLGYQGSDLSAAGAAG
jgi:NAD(P)-dependent dehydrogenase (short-subunit alcohol dehydrogenase family)